MRDLRKYARQTRAGLLAGIFLLVMLVGTGLIYLIYGKEAALMGFVCLLGALIPVGLIVLVLWIIERVVKHANRE